VAEDPTNFVAPRTSADRRLPKLRCGSTPRWSRIGPSIESRSYCETKYDHVIGCCAAVARAKLSILTDILGVREIVSRKNGFSTTWSQDRCRDPVMDLQCTGAVAVLRCAAGNAAACRLPAPGNSTEAAQHRGCDVAASRRDGQSRVARPKRDPAPGREWHLAQGPGRIDLT
jgi:hypothetical protein